ncbi:hypothetical protein C8039_17915 [Halogeometricum sp. wsp3]|nr:hypothetical protein C8039_17915 [Halogeometricum sp. wsp3]
MLSSRRTDFRAVVGPLATLSSRAEWCFLDDLRRRFDLSGQRRHRVDTVCEPADQFCDSRPSPFSKPESMRYRTSVRRACTD